MSVWYRPERPEYENLSQTQDRDHDILILNELFLYVIPICKQKENAGKKIDIPTHEIIN